MSIGKLKRQTSSYKLDQRSKEASAAQASNDALAREQALARDVEDKLRRNKTLILVVISLVLVGGGVYATQESRQSRSAAELTDLFRKGTQAAEGRVVKEGAVDNTAADQAGSPLQVPNFESPDERLEAMQTAFQAVVQADAKSGAAHLATLGMAAAALQQGDGDTAAKHLNTFLAVEKKDTVFRRRALEMQAHALEAQGKNAEGAAKLAGLAKSYHEEVKRLAATAAAEPSVAIDARLKRTRDHAVSLFVEAASMYRRATMMSEALALLEIASGDDELKKSTERFRVDEGLNILGKKGI